MILPEERFNRFVRLVGKSGLERLQGACAMVVGVGAVGSFAVEALARSGVGHLILVDFDTVQPSNINRQLFALETTLGIKKVDVARTRVHGINPECVVETLDLFVDASTVNALSARAPDIVLDAIDMLDGKAALWRETARCGIPLVASMGAARRSDATMVRTAPFAQVYGCPLAKTLRRMLFGTEMAPVYAQNMCVYSAERPVPSVVERAEKAVLADGQAIADAREKRSLPSSVMVTGVFGLNLANLAVRAILSGEKV